MDKKREGQRGKSAQRGGHSNRGKGGKSNEPVKKKENILDLSKYTDKKIIVKYQGGRQVVGILKGYDLLQNLVLDETFEYVRDINDPSQYTDELRELGLVVTRGTAIILISPYDGQEDIANPFQE
ncbi:Sm-like protein lsm7 [Boothiomyces macroporosus]|uniref:Sm-like protein lsm7 n=1 Tax=Boothiomyces macroporosus TaxID=261099 RepID=A0AAD5UE53_9FUNG|nr:Sm-like protein lsm7 [Boothiomyces macroporosus]